MNPIEVRNILQFNPSLVYFEPKAREYPLGQKLYQRFQEQDIPIRSTTSHNQVRNIPGDTELQQYRNAKRTLVVGVRKTLDFDTSKPSAEYAIPLTTGCAGHCHYCYLQTTMSAKPYVRVYVNTDEILERAKSYIDERAPEITRFEAACTGDPMSIEHLTGSLHEYIQFMGKQEYGRLRFVTKFANVDPILTADHRQHTQVRFSVNTDYVIKNFEPATSSFDERIEAAGKVAEAGYPLGFLIAPIIHYDQWQEDYADLIDKLRQRLQGVSLEKLTFELIQHRFTKVAKRTIEKRYPKSKLEMNEEQRQVKWGRYGRFKYIYQKDTVNEMKDFFYGQLDQAFPEADILYWV